MVRAAVPSQSRLTLAAHELRTPLSVAIGYLGLLRRQAAPALTTDLLRLVEESERACRRLTGLITEMSRLGQLEAGTLAWAAADVDVREVLRAAAADHAVPDLGDRPSIVRADPERLREAFGSLVRVTARRLGERPLAVVQRHAGARITVVMADADLVPVLLRARPPVCAFDEAPGGFGLVLPVARCVIEACGGSLHSPCADGVAHPGAVMRWPAPRASRARGVRE